MKPDVSVIMLVLNGERLIGEALQSIADQTYTDLEVVVVDDGSTDATPARVDAFRHLLRIRYVRHETPHGITASVNDGLRHASGDLIAFLDHDDGWLPDFLETQTSYLAAHPDVGMVHSDFQTIDIDGRIIEASVARSRGRRRPSGEVFRELFLDSFIVGNSALIRRECFERLGGFDESLRWGDYHMWLRIARHYRIDYVDRVLTKYRQHQTQSTRTSVGRTPDEPPVGLQAIDKLLEQDPGIRHELGAVTIRRRRASFYFDLAFGWYAQGEMGHARLCLRRALRLWPWNRRYLMLYAAALLGPTSRRAARAAWRRLRGRDADAPVGVRGITG
jgi:cellulose synthase/poly-beta-1,6-N-acetylglucosamine synthase-like glycosyltransferase